jgi:hypothetical protein
MSSDDSDSDTHDIGITMASAPTNQSPTSMVDRRHQKRQVKDGECRRGENDRTNDPRGESSSAGIVGS